MSDYLSQLPWSPANNTKTTANGLITDLFHGSEGFVMVPEALPFL